MYNKTAVNKQIAREKIPAREAKAIHRLLRGRRETLQEQTNMEQLRALARYKTHGGYVWAAVMNDGELVCTPCVRANYRQIFASTKHATRDGWQCVGIANSGEWESPEMCAHCYQELGT